MIHTGTCHCHMCPSKCRGLMLPPAVNHNESVDTCHKSKRSRSRCHHPKGSRNPSHLARSSNCQSWRVHVSYYCSCCNCDGALKSYDHRPTDGTFCCLLRTPKQYHCRRTTHQSSSRRRQANSVSKSRTAGTTFASGALTDDETGRWLPCASALKWCSGRLRQRFLPACHSTS